MKLKFTLAGLSALTLLTLMLAACTDDDSYEVVVENFEKSPDYISSTNYRDGDFSCVVEKYTSKLVLLLSIKDSIDASEEFSVKENGTTSTVVDVFYPTISASEFTELCVYYDGPGTSYDSGSFLCENMKVHYSITRSSSESKSLSSMETEMEGSCRDYLNEWSGYSSSSVSYPSSDVSTTNFLDVEVIAFEGASAAGEKIVKDNATLFFEDFTSAASEKNLEEATSYAIALSYGRPLYLPWNLTSPIQEGSLEFFFRPHEDFFESDRALVGNDGSRLLVYYSDDNLVFMMNRSNEFGFVKAPAQIKKDWNFVRGDWDGEWIYLFLNGELIGSEKIGHGYEASTRTGENQVVVGYKSSCCMSGAGQKSEMYAAADFGPIRISNAMRSKQ